jgi:hypothetical protein
MSYGKNAPPKGYSNPRGDGSSAVPNAGRAPPSCSKCLQTGHWSYECKNEKVYLARPSATQRLALKRSGEAPTARAPRAALPPMTAAELKKRARDQQGDAKAQPQSESKGEKALKTEDDVPAPARGDEVEDDGVLLEPEEGDL